MNPQQFQKLQKKAGEFRFEDASQRLVKLKKIADWIELNESLILEALKKDFKKPFFETQISEILPVLSEIKLYKKNLKKWLVDKKVSTPVTLLGHSSRIRYDNKGVILIISPWNYPFQLAVAPLVAALAAGNTAVVKPSELTQQTALLIQKLITDCFSESEVLVELGDKEKTQELLCYEFNHVFFTGSTEVGRVIAKACAERLIPVTLELGGKSPTIVEGSADLEVAAEKIFWGKFLNRGQTCVAPDYVIAHESIFEELKTKLQNLIQRHENDEKGSIINESHLSRLQKHADQSTSVNNVALTLTTTNLSEEIFGPVLPILKYKTEAELFALVRQHPTPLSIYIFSKSEDFINRMLIEIPSGGAGVNTVVLQFANHNLPFGGLGASGMGRYHGHFGFLEFSHQRAVLEQKFLPQMREFLQPPYTDFKYKLIQWMKRT